MACFAAPHVAIAVVGEEGIRATAGDAAHRFPLASVTKPLTAYAVLVAAEEGTVRLDEPAGPPGATVAHLLAHASGLGPNSPVPLGPPGGRRIYSNAGFEVLAAHVEAASGIAFADYLDAAVFEPLGMRSTTLDGSPAYGGTSTAGDLVAFASELLAPRLISTMTLAEATHVAFPGLAGVLPGFGRQDPNDFGLGFEIRDHKTPHWTGSRNSPAAFGHFGQSGTFLLVDPAVPLAVVVLTDRGFGPWAAEAWPRFLDEVLEDAALGAAGR